MARFVSAVITFALVLLAAGDADARPAKCRAPWLTGPVVESRHGLALTREDTLLECTGRRSQMRCRFQGLYVVHNATDATLVVPAAVYSDSRIAMSVRVDGEQPSGAAVPSFSGDDEIVVSAMIEDDRTVTGFVLLVPARGSSRVEVTSGDIRYDAYCPDDVPFEQQHPWVGGDMLVGLTIGDRGTHGFSPAAAGRQRLHVPRHWTLRRPSPRTRDRSAGPGWRVGSTASASWRIHRRPPILWGGPFVGIGVAARRGAELKLRAGWEIAGPRWLVLSAAVESDARRHVEFVPALALIPRRWPAKWLPFPSAGVGVPAQLWPSTRAGVRSQLGIHWFFLGILGFVDVYPKRGDQARLVTGGAVVQLGF